MYIDKRKIQSALLDIASDLEAIKQSTASTVLKSELTCFKCGQRLALMQLLEGVYVSH